MTQEAKFKFSGDTSNLQNAVAKAKGMIASVGKVAEKSGSMLGGFARMAVGAAGAFVSISAAVNVARAAFEKFSHVGDVAETTGFTPEYIQKLGAAAAVSNASIDDLATATLKFAKTLTFAKEGDAASTALNALGLSVSSLQQMKPDEVFTKVATAVAGIVDPFQRAAAAQILFGKSGAALVPTFKELASGQSNVTMLTREQIATLKEAGDQWERWKYQALGAIAGVQADLIKDPITTLMKGALFPTRIIPGAGEAIDDAFNPPKKNYPQGHRGGDKPDFAAILARQAEEEKDAAKAGERLGEIDKANKSHADARTKATAKAAEAHKKTTDEISQNEEAAADIRHQSMLAAMDDEKRLAQLLTDRAELEKKIAAETNPVKKSALQKDLASLDGSIASLRAQGSAPASGGGGSGGGSSTPDQASVDPNLTPDEIRAQSYIAANTKEGRIVNPGIARHLNNRAALSRARADRWNAQGIGGPASKSGQGETGAAAMRAAEMFPDFSKENAAAISKAAADREAGIKKSMMGDGSKESATGDSSKKDKDSQSAMAADLKMIREDIHARLPKKTL